MAHSIVMPALELAQESGKLIAWRKKENEAVTKGEPLLDVETDKAVVEIESPADGILTGVTAQEGDTIPVGQTIAWIVAPGEKPPAEAQSGTLASGRRVEAVSSSTSSTSPPTSTSAATSSNIRVSPKARRLAREHNIDLHPVRGTGSDGEILADDVLALVKAPAAFSTQSAATEPLSSVAWLMAERTTQSWTSIPHFFVGREVDATALVAIRRKFAAGTHGAKITHTDILVALVARVLAKHPQVNATWTGDTIRVNPEINIGIAMAVDNGVVSAVITGANAKSLAKIADLRSELTDRARSGKLRPSDITGATFTISNLGMYNVDAFTAIIPAPQAAILAVGRIADRVIAIDGKAAVRPMVILTLSSDHRVIDGARAALFLNDLAEAMRDSEKSL